MQKSIAFAKEKMETEPNDDIYECESKYIPESEENFIRESVSAIVTRKENERMKYRNRGLSIILISVLVFIYACFLSEASSMTGVLAVLSVFAFFVGLIVFGRHLKPVEMIRIPKSSTGTKSIIKGAVVGGIIAGGAGAVVGATIAKNNLDNK